MMSKMVQKLGLLGLIGLSIISYAQDGRVGINTEEPTQTLDVNGSLRVRTLLASETDSKGVKQRGFTYNVVATEDGTLAKQKVSRKRWSLYESSFNLRQNTKAIMPTTSQVTIDYTFPQNAWVIPDSELFIEVPNEVDTNVLTKAQWNTWFEIQTRDITDSDRGSFRFYIRYVETDENGRPLNSIFNYTSTIYMTSFSNINKAISGGYHRMGMSPAYIENNEFFFKKGKYYKIWLVVGVESMREAGKLIINNWGIDGIAETYYQYK